MILQTLGRMVVVPIAFLLALAAAGFVVVTLGLEKITLALYGKHGADLAEGAAALAWNGALVATSATVVPALLVVIVGEVWRIRSWIYYMVGGGASLAALPLLIQLDRASTDALAASGLWHVFATAGFAGGIVYWLVAGRNA